MKLIDCEYAKQAMRQAFQEDVDKYGVEIPECFDADRACEILDKLPGYETVYGYDLEYLLWFAKVCKSYSATPADIKEIASTFKSAVEFVHREINKTMEESIRRTFIDTETGTKGGDAE